MSQNWWGLKQKRLCLRSDGCEGCFQIQADPTVSVLPWLPFPLSSKEAESGFLTKCSPAARGCE